MEDPITLNTAPDDEPREWKAGRVKEYCDKNVSGLLEELNKYAPECCAGYWSLFGCHRPYCLNNPEMLRRGG